MINSEPLSPVSKSQPGTEPARPATPLTMVSAFSEAASDQAHAARAIDAKSLEKALSNLTANVQNLQRSLHFSVDKESGETVVRVVDTETHEVIRQIPSEELLNIAEGLRTTPGLLLSDQA